MSKRIKEHLRSNVVGYIAIFLFAIGGTAYATHPGGANTISSGDIINSQVGSPDLATNSVNVNKITTGAVRTAEIADTGVQSIDIMDGALTSDDLGSSSVGSSEIATDSVGGSEIASGAVGADEMRTPHEHFSPVTNVVDTAAHDAEYGIGTATVACGSGEELLSVAIDWTDTNGHFERHMGGVPTINHGSNPQTASVEGTFDGGGGNEDPASFQAVAICIA